MTDQATITGAAAYIRECTDPECRFRFPAAHHETIGDRCPRCGGVTVVAHVLPAQEETFSRPSKSADPNPGPLAPIAAVLDNVRSTFNVGSIFRSADGAGIAHLYLCGVTPTPAHAKLAKTALGAERAVPWSYHNNAVILAHDLNSQGWTLWALEEDSNGQAVSLFSALLPSTPLLLVIGSEVTGVDPSLLCLCEEKLAIPMRGHKRSLNVATAFGVAAVVLAERRAKVVGD